MYLRQSSGQTYTYNYITFTGSARTFEPTYSNSYGCITYYNNLSNQYKAAVFNNKIYNESGQSISYSSLGLSTNQDWLLKFNIIRNGVKIREDYRWFINTGDSSTRPIRSVIKFQENTGTYYMNGIGELITPEEFPDGEVTYEFTLDITKV